MSSFATIVWAKVLVDRRDNALTATEVLRRYKDEELPEFLGIPLEHVNQPGNSGDTPLHVATIRGEMDEIAALILAGAEVNAHGDLGNTPLHNAVGNGHLEAIKLLLQHGASPSIKNEFGESPIDIANSRAKTEISGLLQSWSRRT